MQWQKGIHSNLGHLSWSLQSMGELACILLKVSLYFLLTIGYIPFIDFKVQYRCLCFDWLALCPGLTTRNANPMRVLIHTWPVKWTQHLRSLIFFKENAGTNQNNKSELHATWVRTHKTVHFSAKCTTKINDFDEGVLILELAHFLMAMSFSKFAPFVSKVTSESRKGHSSIVSAGSPRF